MRRTLGPVGPRSALGPRGSGQPAITHRRDPSAGVGVDLVALHDVIVGNFLAGISIDLGVFDAVASVTVDLVEAYFLGIGSGRIQSDRQVTSERRKKPFQLARGAISNTPNSTEPGFRISSEPMNHGRQSAASAFFNSLLD
jgi:hypothetical protein